MMNVEKEHFSPTKSDPLDPETPYGPDPDDCQCNELGSVDLTCNCGKCLCKTNVVGDTCDQCEIEHYDFPNCKGRCIHFQNSNRNSGVFSKHLSLIHLFVYSLHV